MNIGSTTKTEDRIVGRVLADKYKIKAAIREDDAGTVYLATHLLMEKPVTVKVLSSPLAIDRQIVERFSLEAKTISRLSHPNVLNVIDFGEDIDGTVFTVLEYVEGTILKDLILREGALPVERAVKIARQIAAALSAAHSSGVIHTALSSRNVLVYDAGNGQDSVKIFDIGPYTSSLKSDPDFGPTMDDVAYLAPEQCSRQSDLDERTDIYSLGIIFYELLSGEVPFRADTVTELMIKHAEVPPPPLAAFRSDIPDEIEPILLNALAKDPDRRFQTAAAFAEDLKAALAEGGEDDTVVIPKDKLTSGAGKNFWKTAFIVLAGISVMALGLIYFTRVDTVEPLTRSLPTDENSQPVQPLNPATGINEQGNLMSPVTDGLFQADPNLTNPSVGGGGDGYDPWANVPVPPSGGRGNGNVPIGPGGEIYTIPGDGSIFMPDPDGGGVILVPKIVPEESPSPKASKSPAATKSPGAASPGPSPKTTQQPPPGPTPPVKKPVKDPQPKQPAKPSPSPQSGKAPIKSGIESDT